VTGKVSAFDERRGLGEVTADDATVYPFHCTAIADGTRPSRSRHAPSSRSPGRSGAGKPPRSRRPESGNDGRGAHPAIAVMLNVAVSRCAFHSDAVAAQHAFEGR
jgi:hypothetical protein